MVADKNDGAVNSLQIVKAGQVKFTTAFFNEPEDIK
jgi:hypothetical protein